MAGTTEPYTGSLRANAIASANLPAARALASRRHATELSLLPDCGQPKPVCAFVVGRQHNIGMLARRMTLGMSDSRFWRVDIQPAGLPEAIPTHVLHVHEVALIEPTNGFESAPTHQKARTRKPTGHLLMCHIRISKVALRPRITRPNRPTRRGQFRCPVRERDARKDIYHHLAHQCVPQPRHEGSPAQLRASCR